MPSNLRNYFKKERASSSSESFFCRGAPSDLYADDAPRDRANPYAGLNGPSFYNTAERSLRDPAPYPVPPTSQPQTYSSEIHTSSRSRDPRRQGAIYQNGIVLPPEARRSEYGYSSHQYADNSSRHRSRSAQPSPGLSGAYPEPDYIPLSLSHLDYARHGGGEPSRRESSRSRSGHQSSGYQSSTQTCYGSSSYGRPRSSSYSAMGASARNTYGSSNSRYPSDANSSYRSYR
ncbi:uncharacterized protein MELLADRAFT_61764 [Melampsora larici-populina 98AG31]|uniref:Uncharacterized protein n=1 Tax=Melampsora larici-populina (strain 98AG31 / pathotype 3-4-7) TaxID=747676 RepID=F4RG20_MELLP|nr:uncharacterized protein MELLADRAFT_61764 [Melampsora larici-populina 98AG31]EGG08477.1 hypothetical protein MELLADRAFT_61764 [Melampsora larici-populina 98AG31]